MINILFTFLLVNLIFLSLTHILLLHKFCSLWHLWVKSRIFSSSLTLLLFRRAEISLARRREQREGFLSSGINFSSSRPGRPGAILRPAAVQGDTSRGGEDQLRLTLFFREHLSLSFRSAGLGVTAGG